LDRASFMPNAVLRKTLSLRPKPPTPAARFPRA
jgi:hypothetical protein